jgi:hypothetical protein
MLVKPAAQKQAHERPRVGVGAGPQPVSGRTGGLTIEVRHDLELDHADVAALDTFIEERPDVGVFMSRAWLTGYLADPPRGADPLILLVREGASLKGIVAIAVRRLWTHLRVSLLGGGEGSDRVDLLAARGYEAACADAFVGWLAKRYGTKACVLELRDVPMDSPLWGALYRINAEGSIGLTVQPREVHALPFLDLAECWSSGIDGHAAASATSSLDRHRRWLERRGRVRFELLEDADDVLAAFDRLTELLHARWGKTAEGSALDQPRAIRFHRRVLPLLLAEKRVRMLRLTVDTRVVAVVYLLASGNWRGSYFTGYDRPWAGRLHLGRLVIAAAIDRAARQGVTEFDFLKGAERVKYLWPVRTRATVNADVYPVNAGAQLVRAAAAARDTAAALTKSAGRLVRR